MRGRPGRPNQQSVHIHFSGLNISAVEVVTQRAFRCTKLY